MRRRFTLILILAAAFTSVMMAWAAPQKQATVFELFVLEIRQDLERAANESLGAGVRPEGWTFNFEPTSETLLTDLWFDNELLAESVFGAGQRPVDWFGATAVRPELLARNVRHDLELIADTIYGENTRPDDWTGAAAIFRCGRTLQNVTRLLEENYSLTPTTAQNAGNYCDALQFELEGTLISQVFEAETDPAAAADITALTLAVRGDLERLANELLGVNTRPGNWTNNIDQASPTLTLDLNTDLETLAEVTIGSSVRPDGWARFVSSSPALEYRFLRFNLELLANVWAQGEDRRPNGWQGVEESPVVRCNTLTQSLVFIAENQFGFVVDEALGGSANFCELLEFTANSFAENPPQPDPGEQQEDPEDAIFTAESQNAFSYLDVSTTQYMGVMPAGTEFRAWWRNFNESTMMYVTGDNFGVFIDRRWTNIDPDIFARLPTLDDRRPLAFCDASWCNGPAPTPTPTGSGPLLLLHSDPANTPLPSTPQPGVDESGKVTVSWNHVRVTYLQDRIDVGVAQVALEICQEPQQITCEPVISVFDNNLGVASSVISQFNGLNVYELPYGYSNAFIIEGTTLRSPDVWISDPTIR